MHRLRDERQDVAGWHRADLSFTLAPAGLVSAVHRYAVRLRSAFAGQHGAAAGRREAAVRMRRSAWCAALVFGGTAGLKIAVELGVDRLIGTAETMLMGSAVGEPLRLVGGGRGHQDAEAEIGDGCVPLRQAPPLRLGPADRADLSPMRGGEG